MLTDKLLKPDKQSYVPLSSPLISALRSLPVNKNGPFAVPISGLRSLPVIENFTFSGRRSFTSERKCSLFWSEKFTSERKFSSRSEVRRGHSRHVQRCDAVIFVTFRGATRSFCRDGHTPVFTFFFKSIFIVLKFHLQNYRVFFDLMDLFFE